MSRPTRLILTWSAIVLVVSTSRAQDAATPPLPPPHEARSATGSGATPADVEQRLRDLAEQLEATQRRHEEQVNLLLQEIAELKRQVQAAAPAASQPRDASAAPAPAGAGSAAIGDPNEPGGRLSPIPSEGVSGARAEEKWPLQARFGPGFELTTEDNEFLLQIHQETQVDFKEFDPNGDAFARSGLVIPRARVFFNGHVGKPYEYMFSLNRGFSAIDLLDAYVNFHWDDRWQVKIGRFMTPFNYEQFAVQNMWLWAPERSLFTANLGLNRQIGAQLWGNVFDKRVDYSIGVFDGPRNSYEDFNESKDIFSYLNIRPFGSQERGSLLRDLNLGGSFVYGAQDNPLSPRSFRTASNQSNASAADLFSPPFLIFNDDVVERGQRTFWSAHAAYFYKSLSLFADYNGGILRYARDENAVSSIVIPTHGYSIAAGYFLTGESMERRTIIEPLRPFNLRRGEFAPGAWEVVARYSLMELDRSIFDQDLANPDLWSNRAWIFNLGVNWYMTRYIKWHIGWQHTEFGNPVIYQVDPERKQLTNQLLWMRLQIYF